MYYKNSDYLAFINVSLIGHMSSETWDDSVKNYKCIRFYSKTKKCLESIS